VPQPNDPSDNVVEEVVHKELGNSLVRAATTASSLEADQDSGNITKNRSKATPNESSSLGTTSGGGPRCQETMVDTIAQTRFENVSKHSNDSLLARGKRSRMIAGVARDDVAKPVFRMRNRHVEVYGYAFWVNQCTSDFHGVNEPGVHGREDVCEVFQQRGSGAKRKLSRCGRNQMGNEPILALPEGADDFVVYYDREDKDIGSMAETKKGEGDCLWIMNVSNTLSIRRIEHEARYGVEFISEFDFEAKYHLGKANVDVVPWSRKKE
ncbi:hypothetical protein Tco_0825687, partial [Tanacetum coccineum]